MKAIQLILPRVGSQQNGPLYGGDHHLAYREIVPFIFAATDLHYRHCCSGLSSLRSYNTRIVVSRCSITLIPLFTCLILAFATSFVLIALLIQNYQVMPNTSFLSVARLITNLVMAPLAGFQPVTGTFSSFGYYHRQGSLAIKRHVANLYAVDPAASVFVTGKATYKLFVPRQEREP